MAMADAGDLLSSGLVRTIEDVATTFSLCRNRVWEIARSVDASKREELLRITQAVDDLEQVGSHRGHDECTFDFCEHSRLDFTAVSQRHEDCDGDCEAKEFDTSVLEKAVLAEKASAWELDGRVMVERPQPFMAISHVWSDGTGAGAWPPGQVNACLYSYFQRLAHEQRCEGLWWDTICIPREKSARTKAILTIQANYEEAQVTLVHDCFLRSWEWISPEVACFAIIVSPWFSRGWTALELASSHKVKIVFKDTVKDLDEDILAKAGSSSAHVVASRVIEGLRKRGVKEVNDVLRILGPRHTSWPRDVAIISGQLTRINIRPGASQQGIYQDVMRKIGRISRENLFHNSVTMSKGFNWCPTSLFSLRQSSAPATLQIGRHGDIVGEWDVFSIPPNGLDERYNFKDTHPLVEGKLREGLKLPAEHLLLVGPEDGMISQALLVKSVHPTMGLEVSRSWEVQFVGPLYFHPALERGEIGWGKVREIKGQVLIRGSSAAIRKEGQNGTTAGTARVEGRSRSNSTNPAPNLLTASADGDVEAVKHLLFIAGPISTNIQDIDKNINNALHLAAQNGHSLVVELLLDAPNVNINAKNRQMKTALHLAIRNGSEEVVKKLLEKKWADLNSKDDSTWTALHHAAWRCNASLVQLLLDAGADTTIQDRRGCNALHLACERGNVGIVRMLLSTNVNPSVECHDRETSLHKAVWAGSAEIATLLLEKCAKNRITIVNAQDKKRRTALWVAAREGRRPIVGELLRHGALTDEREGTHGTTALHVACEQGHASVVSMLAPHGELRTQDADEMLPLTSAARRGHVEVLEVLLRSGVGPDHNGFEERTALMFAAENGSLEIVELLLDLGANSEWQDIHRRSALSLAAENGHLEIVELLIENGAFVDDRDGAGFTPLTFAAHGGHEEVVKVLLDSGAHPAGSVTKRRPGVTPLLAASISGHEVVVKLLLQEREVNVVEIRDGDGRSPLSEAVAGGHTEVVKLLLWAGADPNHTLQALEGRDSPIQLAIKNGFGQTIRLLLEHNVKTSDTEKETALKWAVGNGEDAIVRHLSNTDVGARLIAAAPEFGNSLLCHAAANGHSAVVRLLLDRGAKTFPYRKLSNFDYLQKRQLSPIWEAFRNEHEPTVRLLLERGALSELEAQDRTEILRWALENGHDESAKLAALIQYGVDDGCLELAVKKGDMTVVERMLDGDGGCQISQYSCEKLFTTLSQAPVEVQGEVVWLMLKNGTKFSNLPFELRGTVLLWASWKGHETLVELMFKENKEYIGLEFKDRQVVRGDERTALSLAAEAGNVSIVTRLLKAGAAVDSRDSYDRTPLAHAAKCGNVEVFKLLLAKGADPSKNFRALQEAVVGGNMEMVKLLLCNGADPRDNIESEVLSGAAGDKSLVIFDLLNKWNYKMVTRARENRRRRYQRSGWHAVTDSDELDQLYASLFRS